MSTYTLNQLVQLAIDLPGYPLGTAARVVFARDRTTCSTCPQVLRVIFQDGQERHVLASQVTSIGVLDAMLPAAKINVECDAIITYLHGLTLQGVHTIAISRLMVDLLHGRHLQVRIDPDQ